MRVNVDGGHLLSWLGCVVVIVVFYYGFGHDKSTCMLGGILFWLGEIAFLLRGGRK